MERRDLKEYLRADLYRYSGAQATWYFLKALSPSLPGFRYSYLLRHAAAFPKSSLRGLLYRVLLRHYGYKYGFQILPNTKIGKGLYIGHVGTLVVNGQSEIGDNATLSHLVTLGQVNRGPKAGCPRIGNKVFIGTGAVVVGKIVVGDNVLIAPNAYVNMDVPGNSIVVGNPARIIPDSDPDGDTTAGYVNFTLDD